MEEYFLCYRLAKCIKRKCWEESTDILGCLTQIDGFGLKNSESLVKNGIESLGLLRKQNFKFFNKVFKKSENDLAGKRIVKNLDCLMCPKIS